MVGLKMYIIRNFGFIISFSKAIVDEWVVIDNAGEWPTFYR